MSDKKNLCVFKVKKLKSAGSISGTFVHEYRQYDDSNRPKNIDKSRSYLNYSLFRKEPDEKERYEKSLSDYKNKLPSKIRKNAVHGIEFVMSASHDFSGDWKGYFEDCLKWVEKKFGKENVLSAVVHMDEDTPHIHIAMIPLVEGKLNARKLIGGSRSVLGVMRTDFWNDCAKNYELGRGDFNTHSKDTDYRDRKKELVRLEKEADERISVANKKISEANKAMIRSSELDSKISEKLEILTKKADELKKRDNDVSLRENRINLREQFVENVCGVTDSLIKQNKLVEQEKPKLIEIIKNLSNQVKMKVQAITDILMSPLEKVEQLVQKAKENKCKNLSEYYQIERAKRQKTTLQTHEDCRRSGRGGR